MQQKIEPESQDAAEPQAVTWTPRSRRKELGMADYVVGSGIVMLGVVVTYFGFSDTLIQLFVALLRRLG